MYTLKFLISSLQNLVHLGISIRQSKTLGSGDLLFIFTVNHAYCRSHRFDVIFIIIMFDERQNVVVKSNILTMFRVLKPEQFCSRLVAC
jgi:hypothetical protein